MSGWLKLHRELKDWEWSNSPKHLALLTHLLIRANYKESKYRGKTIMAGQLMTGRKQLAKWSGLTEQNVRTVLKNLISTNEITIVSHGQYSIITISKWDKYQDTNQGANQELTKSQPSTNQELTTSKKNKNIKKEKNNINVSFDTVNQLFQDICVKTGKFKSAPFYSADSVKGFQILSGFPHFQKTENWKEYFTIVSRSEFLGGNNKFGFVANFSWLLNSKNAEKVLEGQYDGEEQKAKTALEEAIDAMSDKEKREVGL